MCSFPFMWFADDTLFFLRSKSKDSLILDSKGPKVLLGTDRRSTVNYNLHETSKKQTGQYQ